MSRPARARGSDARVPGVAPRSCGRVFLDRVACVPEQQELVRHCPLELLACDLTGGVPHDIAQPNLSCRMLQPDFEIQLARLLDLLDRDRVVEGRLQFRGNRRMDALHLVLKVDGGVERSVSIDGDAAYPHVVVV